MSTKKPSRPSNKPKARRVVIDDKVCHKTVTQPKEYVMAYDVQGMRKLVVPNRDPHALPAIIPKSEFERLKNQAHIVTLQDRMKMLDDAEQEKNALQMESEKRKQFLKSVQATQHTSHGTLLGEVEREAKTKNMYLLQRSFDLIQEQDNRVKRANGIILATKCRAIRNAQIAEKELIKRQLDDENRRLDLMMEQKRQQEIEAAQKLKEEEEKKKQRYIDTLSDQIRMNEIERLIEAEHVEEESRVMNKAFLLLQKEEEQRRVAKQELQQKIRDDLKQANLDLEHYKMVQKEEERIADLRIQKFMKEKLDREIAREQELALAKAAKEQEITRLRSQQLKSQDHKMALDEMNALRLSEEKEKKYREDEMKAAKARKEQQEMLKRDRENQIATLQRTAAITLARDEEDFHRVAQVQKEEWEKEQQKDSKKKEQAAEHRKGLLKQINDKERERINLQKDKFEEGKMRVIEQQIKDRHVREHLKKKIDDLRSKQVPEQYVQDIEHHIEAIIKSS